MYVCVIMHVYFLHSKNEIGHLKLNNLVLWQDDSNIRFLGINQHHVIWHTITTFISEEDQHICYCCFLNGYELNIFNCLYFHSSLFIVKAIFDSYLVLCCFFSRSFSIFNIFLRIGTKIWETLAYFVNVLSLVFG